MGFHEIDNHVHRELRALEQAFNHRVRLGGDGSTDTRG